jgi:hypothetical protein
LSSLPKNNYFNKLLNLVKKTKQNHVLPKLTNCIFATTIFDLWMFKATYDVFALVLNFMGFD